MTGRVMDDNRKTFQEMKKNVFSTVAGIFAYLLPSERVVLLCNILIRRPAAGIRKSSVAGLLTSRKEGVFSVWFSWARALGACAGFSLATALPGNIGKKIGVSFGAGMIRMIVVIFGNISSFRGAIAAGHVIRSENASPLHKHEAGSDYTKGSVTMEDSTQRKGFYLLESLG